MAAKHMNIMSQSVSHNQRCIWAMNETSISSFCKSLTSQREKKSVFLVGTKLWAFWWGDDTKNKMAYGGDLSFVSKLM